MKTAAIILAAGLGSRMGSFKPLVNWGVSTFIETLVDCFIQASVDSVLVVTGYRQAALLPVIKSLGIDYVFNPRYREEMWLSVLCGIEALPKETEAFFVMPVDIPGIQAATVAALINAARLNSGQVIYPRYQGRRGHPPLIPRSMARVMREWEGAGGLRAFLQEQEKLSMAVDVDDPGILKDYDRPEDLPGRHNESTGRCGCE